jgi:hypothetical protein
VILVDSSSRRRAPPPTCTSSWQHDGIFAVLAGELGYPSQRIDYSLPRMFDSDCICSTQTAYVRAFLYVRRLTFMSIRAHDDSQKIPKIATIN